MDAQAAKLEAFMAAIPSLIEELVANILDTKLQMYFEQFWRELHYRGPGEGQSHIVVPKKLDPSAFGQLQRLWSPIHDDDDPLPRPQWFHKLDFPRFTKGDDHLAWIFKAKQYFSFYNIPTVHRVLTASFHLDGEIL